MANHTCTKNCGCRDTYVVTQPCPPSCPEVFNAQCIVYTGTDITCNQDIVIRRYDYLDTVITKLVNYICNVEAPVTVVAGSEYIDVVPTTVGNVTTYTVSIDIPALQAYFDIVIAQTILASILAGPGIDVFPNPITGSVTIAHEDTSSVSNLSSDNSGNSFIQDVFFTFDTYGHVTGASVIPGTVIPPNDFDRATVNPDSGFVWGPNNDPTNIQIAEAPGDTLNFVAGVGITLNASTVPSTDAIRITNNDPGSVQNIFKNIAVPTQATIVADSNNDTLNFNVGPGIDIVTNATTDTITITNTDPGSAISLSSSGGDEDLVVDGTAPTLEIKGLTAGSGIALTGSATDVTIATTFNKYTEDVFLGVSPAVVSITHNLNTLAVIVSVVEDLGVPNPALALGSEYAYKVSGVNSIDIESTGFSGGTVTVTVIG